jgi:hypothetical protein
MNHTNEDIASPRWECLDISLFQSEADVLLSLIWLYFSYVQQLNPPEKLIWLMAVDNPDILTRISNMVQKANV